MDLTIKTSLLQNFILHLNINGLFNVILIVLLTLVLNIHELFYFNYFSELNVFKFVKSLLWFMYLCKESYYIGRFGHVVVDIDAILPEHSMASIS